MGKQTFFNSCPHLIGIFVMFVVQSAESWHPILHSTPALCIRNSTTTYRNCTDDRKFVREVDINAGLKWWLREARGIHINIWWCIGFSYSSIGVISFAASGFYWGSRRFYHFLSRLGSYKAWTHRSCGVVELFEEALKLFLPAGWISIELFFQSGSFP